MRNNRTLEKIIAYKPRGKRSLGRLLMRWREIITCHVAYNLKNSGIIHKYLKKNKLWI
jgi:hypothetical protein